MLNCVNLFNLTYVNRPKPIVKRSTSHLIPLYSRICSLTNNFLLLRTMGSVPTVHCFI